MMSPLLPATLFAAAILLHLTSAAFHGHGAATLQQQRCSHRGSSWSVLYGANDESNAASNKADAELLLAKAKAIRDSLPATTTDEESSSKISSSPEGKILSEFSLPQSFDNSYRLYLDIGREPGTWMDPRWGASGKRIECTLDVAFVRPIASVGEGDTASQPEIMASGEITAGLRKTITSKSSSLSPVYTLPSAPSARLNSGWGKMYIDEGGFCIESLKSASLSSSSTLRFCISVDGVTEGDVSIPEGNLYFALPYFGLSRETNAMNLSTKEGTITVKQMGWNTGWRREESRILGVFRAVPLEKAKARDKF